MTRSRVLCRRCVPYAEAHELLRGRWKSEPEVTLALACERCGTPTSGRLYLPPKEREVGA